MIKEVYKINDKMKFGVKWSSYDRKAKMSKTGIEPVIFRVRNKETHM